MNNESGLRVALCGIGLEAYWNQFADLEERLKSYVARVADRLSQPGVAVVNLGLVDTPQRSLEAGRRCRREDIDLLFLYVTTYALSNTVLPLVQRAAVPVIVLNLQPEAAIDYAAFNRLQDRTAMTGEWLAFCSACPVPELANVLLRAQIPFHQVTGMLDIMTDVTQISIAFGAHAEMLEVDELSGLRAEVSEEDISRRVAEFSEFFDVQPDCAEDELQRAARTSVALDAFVTRHQLDAMAYYYKGTGNSANEDVMSSIILGTSLLTARHIPVAGEYEVKNAIAMKMMDVLGAGGSFTEYYAIDFNDDLVLMGHDGPGHLGIAEGKTKVKPLKVYHGKVGRGLSVEMSVRHGPVTLLSVAEDAERRFKLVVAEGESVPGPILEIGNTNSRYRFPMAARGFVEAWNANGPAHHCAVGVGHVASTLRKAAALMGLGFCRVC